MNDIERSQDWPAVWEGSPACRMTRTRYFGDLIEQTGDPLSLTGKTYDVANCLGYEIPPEEAFDIDEEMDFVRLKACFRTVAVFPALEEA